MCNTPIVLREVCGEELCTRKKKRKKEKEKENLHALSLTPFSGNILAQNTGPFFLAKAK